MPSWVTIDFVAANWQPLLVALVLGYILGWLFTGIPNKRHANEAEDRAASAETRLRKSERELTDVRRESEQSKTRAASLQVDLDATVAKLRTLEEASRDAAAREVAEEDAAFPDAKGGLPAGDDDGLALLAEVDEELITYAEDEDLDEVDLVEVDDAELDDLDLGDADLDDEEWMDAMAQEGVDDETQTMLIPAVEPQHDDSGAVADVSRAFAAVAQSPDLSDMPTSKDIALTEAYARVTTLQTELERNDLLLRTRQADIETLRGELAAANAARHELENRLIRAREDVASELAVLASTMIKMKEEALQRADARIAALASEIEELRNGGRASATSLPKPPAQIGRVNVPQATAAGWEPGPYLPDDEDAQADLPDMAKAVAAIAQESDTASSEVANPDETPMPGLDPVAAANDSSDTEQA